MHSSAAAAPRPATERRATRGDAHLWVPRELGNAGLVLGLAADTAAGVAHNVSAIARLLTASRPAVRGWIAWLVEAGLVLAADGFLRPTPAGDDAMRRSDPLPRALLRRTQDRIGPTLLRACAAVTRETVGPRADRRYVCTDADRGADAMLGRRVIAKARRLLTEAGIVKVEDVQRRRAGLLRVVAAKSESGVPCSAAGRPWSEARQKRLAELAARGRRGGNCRPSGGGNWEASPLVSPTAKDTQYAGEPAATDGAEIAFGFDGSASKGRGRPATTGAILDELLAIAAGPDRQPAVPPSAAVPDGPDGRTAAHEAACADLRRLAADRGALARLLGLPADRGCAELLALLRIDDLAPRRRAGHALQAARLLGVEGLLALALDALLGRPRNLGAVVVQRIRRVAAGTNPVTRCRADWTLARFLDAVTRTERTGATRPAPQPRDHDPHRLLRLVVAAEAAARGDWRRVDELAQRHGLDLAAIADRASISPRDLRLRLDGLAAQRLEAFTAGRSAC